MICDIEDLRPGTPMRISAANARSAQLRRPGLCLAIMFTAPTTPFAYSGRRTIMLKATFIGIDKYADKHSPRTSGVPHAMHECGGTRIALPTASASLLAKAEAMTARIRIALAATLTDANSGRHRHCHVFGSWNPKPSARDA
jgi:hypothetical protein